MKLTLRQQLAQFGHLLQDELFPVLEQPCGALDETSRRLIAILEMIPLGRFIPIGTGRVGRPARDRYAIRSLLRRESSLRHQFDPAVDSTAAQR